MEFQGRQIQILVNHAGFSFAEVRQSFLQRWDNEIKHKVGEKVVVRHSLCV